MSETPLIYTAKGNMPVESLTRKVEWVFEGKNIMFIEEYYDGDELVKRGCDLYIKDGLTSTDTQEHF